MGQARIQISDGSFRSTYPVLVLGYEAARGSQNVVHDVVGGGVVISLLRSSTRSGTLRLFYMDRETGYAAFDLLSERSTFSFDEDYLSASTAPTFMLFAVVGQGVSIRLDETTRKRWIVECEFQELSQV